MTIVLRVTRTHRSPFLRWTVMVTVERKKGRRWVRVTRKTVFGTSATLKFKRLKRGTHRVRISISSSAGNGTSVSKTFRVR